MTTNCPHLISNPDLQVFREYCLWKTSTLYKMCILLSYCHTSHLFFNVIVLLLNVIIKLKKIFITKSDNEQEVSWWINLLIRKKRYAKWRFITKLRNSTNTNESPKKVIRISANLVGYQSLYGLLLFLCNVD